MIVRGRFVLNRFGVRHQMLLDQQHARVTPRLVEQVRRVAPPGTEVFVSESRGRAGRVVVWLFDRTDYNARSPSGRRAERRWKKSQLLRALERLRAGGAKFMRSRRREF